MNSCQKGPQSENDLKSEITTLRLITLHTPNVFFNMDYALLSLDDDLIKYQTFQVRYSLT